MLPFVLGMAIGHVQGGGIDEEEPRPARAPKITAKFTDMVVESSKRLHEGTAEAVRKLQRRQSDSKGTGLFSGISLTETNATELIRSIMANAVTERFGRLKMSGYAGKRGIAYFDAQGRGVLVTQAGGFITFLEEGRGLSGVFRGNTRPAHERPRRRR